LEPFDVTEPYRVEHLELQWARIDGRGYRATVWRPATDRPTRAPWATLLDVPGGPWTCFDRSVDFYFNRKLAACGAVVVAVDFRLPPDHAYPSACIDVNAATRWLKREAAALGGTARRLGGVGASSGGHLALLSALRPHDPVYAGAAGHETVEPWAPGVQPDAALAYVMALWPITDVPGHYDYALGRPVDDALAPYMVKTHEAFYSGGVDQMREASPLHTVREGRAQQLPPVLLQLPELDTQVPVSTQEAFVETYRLRGGSIERAFLPGMSHSAANYPGDDADHCVEVMKRFVAAQLSP
jgi:acetyl esterase/lipase